MYPLSAGMGGTLSVSGWQLDTAELDSTFYACYQTPDDRTKTCYSGGAYLLEIVILFNTRQQRGSRHECYIENAHLRAFGD